MDITISDVGHALVAMDQELDSLEREFVMLELKKQLNRQRANEVRAAMKKLIATSTYDITGDLGC